MNIFPSNKTTSIASLSLSQATNLNVNNSCLLHHTTINKDMMQAMQHSRQPLGRRTNQEEQKKSAVKGTKKKQQQQFGDSTATENATPYSFRRSVRATLTPRSMLNQEIQLSGDTSFISLSSPATEMSVQPALPSQKGIFTTTKATPEHYQQTQVRETTTKSSIFKSTLQKLSEAPKQTTANAPGTIVRKQAPALVVDTSAIPHNTLPTKTIPTSQGDASLDAALKGLMDAVMTPPSTTKSAGVCMDLSSMFCEAAQGTAPPKKPPISRKHSSFVPGRSHGSSKKSRLVKTRGNRPTMPPTQLMPATTCADEQKNKEAWAKQQEETFTTFLNYILCPPDEADTLQWYQRYAKARLKARVVFANMSTTRDTLLSEISSGRVTIRTDKDISADLTVRAEVMELLHSFQPQWLRLGLETMLGDIQNKMTIKEFILERFLSDRKLLRKYTRGKCNVPSGRFEKEYKQEMRQLVLYRLLVLFFFLEQAKISECFEQPLFNASAKYKATKDILNALSRIVLHGQGNFARHLERQGLKVEYKQSTIDELDFRITNLATDLRDGSRLARWTEELLHLPRFELIQKLELPAGSRLQKIRNLQRVLGQLVHLVPDNKVLAHHIVDGYRDRVFLLLWSLVAKSCLDELLPVARVHEEIERLEKLRSFSTHVFLPTDLKGSLLIWADLVCRRFGRSIQNWTNSFFDGVVVCMLIHYYHPRLLRIEDIDYSEQSAYENAKRANKVLAHLGGMPHHIVPSNPSEESMLLALTCLCSRLMSSSAEDRASRLIQFAYRAHLERITEKRRKAAALLIWKAWVEHRDVYYASQRYIYSQAVAVLENFVLRYKRKLSQLRQSRQEKHQSALMIQKHVRGFLARMQVGLLLQRTDAAVTIQLWWTRVMVQKIIRNDAAITLQYWWRSSLSRVHQQLLNVASQVIQKYWRGFCARRQAKMIQAATKIQRMWKVFQAQVNLQVAFIDIITVQSCARRFLALQASRRRRQAVYVLQKQFRTYLLARRARIQNQSARCIQIAYLRYRLSVLSKNAETEKRHAAVRIQSAWRRFFAVSRAAKLLGASLLIQATYRRFAASSDFHVKRKKIVVVQSLWRSFISRQHFYRAIEAVVSIQNAWRRHHAKQRFHCAIQAAISIQTIWRCYLLRNRYFNIVLPAVDHGVKKLQARIRGIILRKTVGRLHESAKVLQAMARQKIRESSYHKTRSQIVSVQAVFRSFVAWKKYSLALSRIIVCQTAARRWLALRKVVFRKSAALKVQSACRLWLAKRALEKMVATRKREGKGARAIQSLFRGYVVRREFAHLKFSAIQIQRLCRGHTARINYYIELVDVVIVQSTARMWKARRVVNERKKSIVLIQSAFRMYSAKKRFCRSREVSLAATFLQRFVKRMLARERLRRESSAVKLQKTWRCYTKHVDYMMAILSCIEIQAAVRRLIAKIEVNRRRHAVVCIQAFARRTLVNRQISKERSSAVQIQAMTRMFFVRSEFSLKKVAIIQMQKVVRGHIERANLNLQHFAASQIQQAWRNYVSLTYFICMEISAVMIQARIRGWLGRRRADCVKNDYLADTFCKNRSARLIQIRYRDYSQRMIEQLSAEVIIKFWKKCRSERTFRKMRSGFIHLQSAFRGFSARQKDPRAKGRVQRIASATANSIKNPDLRLCNKTTRALNRLRKSMGLSDILDAIQVLERATRYSSQCCLAFTCAGAPDILFSLVRSCNRSLPHIELLEWILLTLSNVAKCDELLDSIATLTGIKIFLDLLQMFRDKEVVFSLSVALLYRSIKANTDLLLYCKTKENKKRLRAVYDVISSRRLQALSESSKRNRSSNHAPKQILVLAQNKEATHSVAQRILHKVITRIAD